MRFVINSYYKYNWIRLSLRAYTNSFLSCNCLLSEHVNDFFAQRSQHCLLCWRLEVRCLTRVKHLYKLNGWLIDSGWLCVYELWLWISDVSRLFETCFKHFLISIIFYLLLSSMSPLSTQYKFYFQVILYNSSFTLR